MIKLFVINQLVWRAKEDTIEGLDAHLPVEDFE